MTQDMEDSILDKKASLCLSISQQPMTLPDITASLASCCDCYMTDTWSSGPHDHGFGWQLQLHPYQQKWHAERVATPQEWRSTRICPVTPYLQHLHL